MPGSGGGAGLFLRRKRWQERGTKVDFTNDISDLRGTYSPGFHLRTHGRGGFIYFIEDEFVIPIAIEMPAVQTVDLLVYGETEHIKMKYDPVTNKEEQLGLEDRFRVHYLLIEWLNDHGYKHDIKIGE